MHTSPKLFAIISYVFVCGCKKPVGACAGESRGEHALFMYSAGTRILFGLHDTILLVLQKRRMRHEHAVLQLLGTDQLCVDD